MSVTQKLQQAHAADLFRHAAAVYIVSSPGTGNQEDISTIETMCELFCEELKHMANRSASNWKTTYQHKRIVEEANG